MPISYLLLISLSFLYYPTSFCMIESPTLKETKAPSKTKTIKAIKNIDRLIELISNQKPQTFTVKSPTKFPEDQYQLFITTLSVKEYELSEEDLNNTQQSMRIINFSDNLSELAKDLPAIKSIKEIKNKSFQLAQWLKRSTNFINVLNDEPDDMSKDNFITFMQIYQSLNTLNIEGKELAKNCFDELKKATQAISLKTSPKTNSKQINTITIAPALQKTKNEKKMFILKKLFTTYKVKDKLALNKKLKQLCVDTNVHFVKGRITDWATYSYSEICGLEIDTNNPETFSVSSCTSSEDSTDDIQDEY